MWQPTPYVFTTELGESCDPRNALRALKAAANRARLPSSVGLHLRHSAPSVMLSAGVPLKVVSGSVAQRRVAPLRSDVAVQIISGRPPEVLQACG